MSDIVIQVEDLTRNFGELKAVDHASFSVNKGEIFGLLGPNGAGKSTLIRMLCTLLLPTEGTAHVAGFDLLKQPDKVRRHIGLVAEKIILYERLTAEENLRLFGRLNHLTDKVIRERTDFLLKLLNMETWRKHLTGTFSTGMKQRINLARALLHEPEILFLDEPTLGLDPQTTRSLHELIKKLSKEGITIILTTHIMSEAEVLSDRIAIIDHGEIIALDTPQALKKSANQPKGSILEIGINEPKAELVSLLRSLSGVTSVILSDEYQLRINTENSDAIDRVIAASQAQRVQIRSCHTLEPTLEDVFLELTGHELHSESKDKVPSIRVDHRVRRAARRIR